MEFRNVQDENAYRLLERIKTRNINLKDREVLAWLREGGSAIRDYCSGYLAELLREAMEMKPYIIEDNIVSITHTAELWGIATSALSADYRKKGYEIKYDRNRKYCKDRVITYVKVK